MTDSVFEPKPKKEKKHGSEQNGSEGRAEKQCVEVVGGTDSLMVETSESTAFKQDEWG